jgi:hypothetical protein
MGVPHSVQNLASSLRGAPHFVQYITHPPDINDYCDNKIKGFTGMFLKTKNATIIIKRTRICLYEKLKNGKTSLPSTINKYNFNK